MARIVLTDASPLIGLTRVDGIGWLGELFGKVFVPRPVVEEVAAGPAGSEAGIAAGFEGGGLVSLPPQPTPPERPPQLGPGEWSCVCAALAHDGPALLLLDDRLARREARLQGLAFAGTAAVVGAAQRRGLIDSARDVFERLLRSDFRISAEVIRAVLADLERQDTQADTDRAADWSLLRNAVRLAGRVLAQDCCTEGCPRCVRTVHHHQSEADVALLDRAGAKALVAHRLGQH